MTCWTRSSGHALERAGCIRRRLRPRRPPRRSSPVTTSTSVDVADVLGQLVDKSLVVADNEDDGGVRYRLLETIRQYAQERLQASGDTAVVRHRHADYYVELAETAGPHLRGREMLAWARVVARDTDNFRAALDWAVEAPSPQHALRLVAPLAAQGSTSEIAIDWAATASTIPGAPDHPLFPEVAAWAAGDAIMTGDFERAEEFIAAASEPKQHSVPHIRRWRVTGQSSRSFAGTSRSRNIMLSNGSRSRGQPGMPTNLRSRWSCSRSRSWPPTPSTPRPRRLTKQFRVARAAGLDTALSLALPETRDNAPGRGLRTRARPLR